MESWQRVQAQARRDDEEVKDVLAAARNKIMRTSTLIFPVVALVVSGCASEDNFSSLYDYYFPKHSEYVNSEYRRSFDEMLFGPPPAKFATERGRQLYFAFHGDSAAFHAFLHHPDRDALGAPGEEWVYECVLLLLRLGDDRFSQLLSSEDNSGRDAVAVALEPMVDWNKHHFPKTRALYPWRKVPGSGGLRRVPLGSP
jgi:hypothetical protein